MFPENYEFYFIARSEGQEMFGRERRVNDCKEDMITQQKAPASETLQ